MNLPDLHSLTLDELIRIAEVEGIFQGAIRLGDKIGIPVGPGRAVLSEAEALKFFQGAIRRHVGRTN